MDVSLLQPSPILRAAGLVMPWEAVGWQAVREKDVGGLHSQWLLLPGMGKAQLVPHIARVLVQSGIRDLYVGALEMGAVILYVKAFQEWILQGNVSV